MRISSLIAGLCLLSFLSAGCVSTGQSGKAAPANEKMVEQCLAKGSDYEKQGDLVNALDQYNRVLALNPSNTVAAKKKKTLGKELQKRAEEHYQAGLKLDKTGKPDQARKEYLAALQNWPDHEGAKKHVTWGSVPDTGNAVVHVICPGESVSKLAKLYYGDYKRYPIISQYNQMKDATQIKIGQKIRIPEIEGFPLEKLQGIQQKYLDAQKSGDAVTMETMTPTEPHKTVESPSAQPMAERPETQSQEATETTPPAIVPEASKEPEQSPCATAQEEGNGLGEQVLAYLGSGIELLEKKQYDEAIVELGKAAEADPDNMDVKKNLYEAHFQQGLLQFNKEEYLDARQHFKTAYQFNSGCANCPDYVKKCTETYMEKHYSLGIQYFGKEQLKEAIAEWQLVEAIDPMYKELDANLKKALMLNERLEKIKQGQTP